MDETSLRTLFEDVVAQRPPTPHLVPNAVRSGRRLRRRRGLLAAASAVIAVGAVAGLVPLVHGLVARPARPAEPSQRTGQETMYVETARGGGSVLVPVNLATGQTGRAIPLDAWVLATASPRARTVWGLTSSALIPLDTTTNTIGRPIALPEISGETPMTSDGIQDGQRPGLAITPNGRTAYVPYGNGVLPVNLSTGTHGALITVPHLWSIAMTPNGKTLYAIHAVRSGTGAMWSATPIDTATGAALRPIRLGQAGTGFLSYPVVSPDGRTIVMCTTVDFQTGLTQIFTIDTTTDSARALSAAGQGGCWGASLEPAGRVAYVAGVSEIMAIDTTTNSIAATIRLPTAHGPSSYELAPAPTGRTLYALNALGGELVQVDAATRVVLRSIRLGFPERDLFSSVLVSGPGNVIYVTTSVGLIPIDVATGRVGRPINLDGTALAVAFAR